MSAPCPLFGFRVLISLSPQGSEANVASIADDLARLLEANDLIAERRTVRDGGLEYLVTREGSQATDSDRTLIRAWAEQWRTRATVQIGDLIDLAEAGE
jgi:uncharacterized protein YggL (DUF469 family)